MNRKIITVPLDGSAQAEQALPLAVQLAGSLAAHLQLVRVNRVEPFIKDNSFENELELFNQARNYLEEIKAVLTDPTLPVYFEPDRIKLEVIYGKASDEIARFAITTRTDLIVMTTHARSPIPDILMGSVARKVVQYSRRPVVLLRPAQTDRPLTLRERLAQLEPEVHQQKRIVLALDGTLEAELGLKPVIELARSIDATVLLLKVVVPILPAQFAGSYSMIDSSIEIDLEQDQALAYDYLEAIQQKVIDQGVRCVCAVRLALPMSNPALEIVDYAFKAKAMLVAMATHTKGSLSRMIFGSISDEVLRQSETPVLFIHTDYSTKAEFVISSEKAGFDEYERIG